MAPGLNKVLSAYHYRQKNQVLRRMFISAGFKSKYSVRYGIMIDGLLISDMVVQKEHFVQFHEIFSVTV